MILSQSRSLMLPNLRASPSVDRLDQEQFFTMSQTTETDLELRAYIRSFPTRVDMEGYVSRIVDSCKSDIVLAKQDIAQI